MSGISRGRLTGTGSVTYGDRGTTPIERLIAEWREADARTAPLHARYLDARRAGGDAAPTREAWVEACDAKRAAAKALNEALGRRVYALADGRFIVPVLDDDVEDLGRYESAAASGEPVPITADRPAVDRACTVVVYDRSGAERFRSPCSYAFGDDVGRFTSRDTPDRDIDDVSLCDVYQGETKLAWFKDMGTFVAGEPVVLTFHLTLT